MELPRFHTANGLHPRFVTGRVAATMRAANFRTLRLSFESAEPGRQRDSSRKVTNQDLASALEALRAAGFTSADVSVYVLMGLPGQERDEVADTLRLVRRLRARSYLARYSPIPGTIEYTRMPQEYHTRATTEPLLHNNTALPYLQSAHVMAPEIYQELNDLSKHLNAQIEAETQRA